MAALALIAFCLAVKVLFSFTCLLFFVHQITFRMCVGGVFDVEGLLAHLVLAVGVIFFA